MIKKIKMWLVGVLIVCCLHTTAFSMNSTRHKNNDDCSIEEQEVFLRQTLDILKMLNPADAGYAMVLEPLLHSLIVSVDKNYWSHTHDEIAEFCLMLLKQNRKLAKDVLREAESEGHEKVIAFLKKHGVV